jgi:hypothetical protein
VSKIAISEVRLPEFDAPANQWDQLQQATDRLGIETAALLDVYDNPYGIIIEERREALSYAPEEDHERAPYVIIARNPDADDGEWQARVALATSGDSTARVNVTFGYFPEAQMAYLREHDIILLAQEISDADTSDSTAFPAYSAGEIVAKAASALGDLAHDRSPYDKTDLVIKKWSESGPFAA